MNLTLALLFGFGSGAVHAVTAPDHLLSIAPVVLRTPERSLPVGTAWGLGHAVGTLVLGLPLLLLVATVDLPRFGQWGVRLAGLALLLTTLWSWLESRRPVAATVDTRAPFVVGSVHGITGAAALLLLLPVLVSGSVAASVGFLLTFAAGSTLGMMAFAWMVGRLGSRLAARATDRLQSAMLVVAVVIGAALLIAG